jgi:hypothetical protein
MKKVDKSEIDNTWSSNEPLFLSYEDNLVGMLKMSDFNQWYPVFVHRSFKYDWKTETSVANPEGISSLHITDIIDWAVSNGFEIYKN